MMTCLGAGWESELTSTKEMNAEAGGGREYKDIVLRDALDQLDALVVR